MYATMCFMKWSWNTRTLATLGGLFSSMVVSMLGKSKCRRSMGAVDTIGCKGTLNKLPSCYKQSVQDLRDFCTWSLVPGHQKCSLNKDNMRSCPWWPTSWWHLFRAATWCALGVMKSKTSSVSPLGIDYRYKAPWWIVKFCWFCRISLPSSLEVWSARRVFKLVWICAFSHSSTTLNIGSSLWALAQSVTCISTIGQAAVTHTSCSTHWSPSIMAGSWVSAWCAAPRATLLRTDFTDLLCGNQWWKCAIILQINACIRSDTTKI